MGAIAGRGAGGRPLRRRREMVLMSLIPLHLAGLRRGFAGHM